MTNYKLFYVAIFIKKITYYLVVYDTIGSNRKQAFREGLHGQGNRGGETTGYRRRNGKMQQRERFKSSTCIKRT